MSELIDEILTAPEADARQALVNASDKDFASLLTTKNNDAADIVLRLLDQHLANRAFSLFSHEELRVILGRANGDALSKVLPLVHPDLLAKLLAKASNELVDKLVSSASSSRIRSNIVKALPVSRRAQWKQYVRREESEIQSTRRLAEEGDESLLEGRKRLLNDINAAIDTSTQMLRNLEDESRIKVDHNNKLLADAQARLSSVEEAIAKRNAAIDTRERALAARLAELEEESRRKVQQKIEAKVPEYVTAALKVLEDREKNYRRKAAQWTVHGTLVLFISIIATVALSVYGYGLTSSDMPLSWQALLFISFKGLVVLGVLGLWAKHAFTLSNAYMHEAIKRSDRAHAITFGKLYLEIYGNTVDRKELLDIFENWNITSESAFTKANPAGFEPSIIDKINEIFKQAERAKGAG